MFKKEKEDNRNISFVLEVQEILGRKNKCLVIKIYLN